jgi:hypothetical protein
MFFYSTASIPAWGLPRLLSSGYKVVVSPPGVKRPGHETDHSTPPSAEVKNDGAILPLSLKSSWLVA